MKRLLTRIGMLALLILPFGMALPVAAASNPLLCFSGTTDGGYGGICTLTIGGATLNNSVAINGAAYSGVSTAVSSLSGKTLAQVGTDQLSFTYTGTPTAGSPRISLPIDTDGNGTTDVYAFIGANLCTSGANLVDAIHNTSCKIFITGGDVGGYTGWAAFAAAFPLAKVGPGVPFIVADDVGSWTVSNIHLGSEVATITTPTNKDQCKDNGYKTFTNPSFKNQGACVSYVQANLKTDKENKGDNRENGDKENKNKQDR